MFADKKMADKLADSLFIDNLATVVKTMGSGRTTLRQLETFGGKFLGSYLRGVYPMGQQPLADGSHHCVIVNCAATAEESMTKGHWICLLRDGKDEVIYDSFGRHPSEFAQTLEHLETTDRDPEQPIMTRGVETQWCGQACIAAGLVCKTNGLQIAKHI